MAADIEANTKAAEDKAFLGCAWYDFTSNDRPVLAFGTWNARELVESQARQISDGMRVSGIKSCARETMLKIPVLIGTEISRESVKTLHNWRDMAAIEAAGFSSGLPSVSSIVQPHITVLRPVGGQHRRWAVIDYLEWNEEQQNKQGALCFDVNRQLVALEPHVLKEKQDGSLKSHEQVHANHQAQLLENLQTHRGELQKLKQKAGSGGKWLVGFYDER